MMLATVEERNAVVEVPDPFYSTPFLSYIYTLPLKHDTLSREVMIKVYSLILR